MSHWDVFCDQIWGCRYRVVVALKLLNHLKPDSVLFFHDFWARYKAYKRVLDFYDVIGYARSLAVLRPKNSTALPRDWPTAYATLMAQTK